MTNKNIVIYHNPRCSKSRETLSLLKENSVEPQIKLYLDKKLTKNELQNLVNLLHFNSIRDAMRTKEALYTELQLAEKNEDELFDAIIAHPILLERPIVVYKQNAKIGRPPEAVLTLF